MPRARCLLWPVGIGGRARRSRDGGWRAGIDRAAASCCVDGSPVAAIAAPALPLTTSTSATVATSTSSTTSTSVPTARRPRHPRQHPRQHPRRRPRRRARRARRRRPPPRSTPTHRGRCACCSPATSSRRTQSSTPPVEPLSGPLPDSSFDRSSRRSRRWSDRSIWRCATWSYPSGRRMSSRVRGPLAVRRQPARRSDRARRARSVRRGSIAARPRPTMRSTWALEGSTRRSPPWRASACRGPARHDDPRSCRRRSCMCAACASRTCRTRARRTPHDRPIRGGWRSPTIRLSSPRTSTLRERPEPTSSSSASTSRRSCRRGPPPTIVRSSRPSSPQRLSTR